jgi:SAM-dependent methyltransferase
MKFKESALAHKYLDGLNGIEIGASAHNPFGIKGCINVDYTRDETPFTQEQLRLCGEVAKVHVTAVADKLPFESGSLDFVLSSHVLEHCWDPVGTLDEWMRVVKHGGYIFMVIPHKDRTFDKDRPRTTLEEIAFRKKPEVDDFRHWNVWVTQDVIDLCEFMRLHVVEFQDVDDKVGNGFTIVLQKVDRPND